MIEADALGFTGLLLFSAGFLLWMVTMMAEIDLAEQRRVNVVAGVLVDLAFVSWLGAAWLPVIVS